MRLLDSITDSMDRNFGKLWEIVKYGGSLMCCSPWGCRESDRTATEQQQCNKEIFLQFSLINQFVSNRMGRRKM